MAKKKILIVDDSEVLCQMMQSLIEENGPFEVRIEINPRRAQAVAKDYNPDLIILDVMMPKLDGVSLAILFKNDLHLNEIPVMFLTALAEEGDFIFGNVFGGYQVISKDVSTNKLIDAIHTNLKKSSKKS